ncbi:MAG: EAL domain-containing protein [Chloroflexota bacterium]|nr:EAL domain-containing protein [Dehalococcoidia bacterium]MDW8252927.1 EAL domain-containing protein [Chloroflexota bacterium]
MKRGLAVLGLILLATVPSVLVLLLVAWFLIDQVHRDLARAVANALVESDRLIERSAAELRDHAVLVGQPCTPEVIARLAEATARSTRLGGIGLLSSDSLVYCSNTGPTALVTRAPAGPAPLEGVYIGWLTSSTSGESSLIVHVRLQNGGLVGRIEAEEFLERIEGNLVGRRGTLQVALVDGPILGRIAPAEWQSSRFVARARSAQYPIEIEAATDDTDVWSRFLQFVPWLIGIGLGIGGLGCWVAILLLRRRRPLDEDLALALKRREFEVHYQPIVDIQAGRCVGAEALLRWRHPKRGLLRPDVFIPLAEQTGVIIPITRWLLDRVRADILLAFPEHRDIHVGINLVAEHLRDTQLVEDLKALFRDGALSPQLIMLEITERQIIDNFQETALQVMRQIHELGCSIAVDDFGTGHSGLAALQRFSVDYLKIDKVFVDTIGTDAVSRPILDSIVDLAHKLHLELIAEGVEQRHQVAYLRARGVRYAQGYYFSPPLPCAAFARFYREYNGVTPTVAASI